MSVKDIKSELRSLGITQFESKKADLAVQLLTARSGPTLRPPSPTSPGPIGPLLPGFDYLLVASLVDLTVEICFIHKLFLI